jgi:hypothetical protein
MTLSGLNRTDLAINYDASKLTVSGADIFQGTELVSNASLFTITPSFASGQLRISVTAAANPIQSVVGAGGAQSITVTTTNPLPAGLSTLNTISISGVTGFPAANGTFGIASVTLPNSFTLSNTVGLVGSSNANTGTWAPVVGSQGATNDSVVVINFHAQSTAALGPSAVSLVANNSLGATDLFAGSTPHNPYGLTLNSGSVNVLAASAAPTLGSFTAVNTTNGPGAAGIGTMLQLTDGSLMVNAGNNSSSNSWWRLLPDSTGNYADGTWQKLANSNSGRLFFGSVVMQNGNVLVVGGEYTNIGGNISSVVGAPGVPITVTTQNPLPTTLKKGNIVLTNVTGFPSNAANGNFNINSPVGFNFAVTGTNTFTLGGTVGIVGSSTVNTGTCAVSNANTGEIFTPPTTSTGLGSWQNITSFPQNTFGDGSLELLDDGTVLAGYRGNNVSYRYKPALDPALNPALPANSNPWPTDAAQPPGLSNTGASFNVTNAETTWNKLPDGSMLTYQLFAASGLGIAGGLFSLATSPQSGARLVFNADPAQDKWVPAGSVPVPLGASGGAGVVQENGPAFLLPDGRVFHPGSSGFTALYSPPALAGNTTGTWVAGPVIPNGMAPTDAPGVMMANGDVLFAVSPYMTNNQGSPPPFNTPTQIDEYNPTTNTISVVPPNDSTMTPIADLVNTLGTITSFTTRMIGLPNGQVMFSSKTGQAYIYTPVGGPDESWRPKITGIASNGDGSYTLTGTQLTGLSEGSTYGDDAQNATNYPIVLLKSSDGTSTYARTTNWSSAGVATGLTPEFVQFTVPDGKKLGDFGSFTVIANGIPSVPAVYGIGGLSILPEYGASSPSIATVNNQAYIAWTGRDNRYLNIMQLDGNGNAVEPHLVTGYTVTGAPTLATVGNQMYVAWTGDDQHIYISKVVISGTNINVVDPPVQLPETSNRSPALAGFNGNLYLAWTGQGARYLNVMQVNPDLTYVEPHYVSGATVDGIPALAESGGQLYVAWTGDSESLYVSTVNTTGPLAVPPPVQLPETSNDSPTLGSYHDQPVIAWTSQGDERLSVMLMTSKLGYFEPHPVSGYTAHGGPFLDSNNGNLLIAWTGTDGDGTLYDAPVGFVPNAPGYSIDSSILLVNGGPMTASISLGLSSAGGVELILNGTTTDFDPGSLSAIVVATPFSSTINVLSTIPGVPVTIDTSPGTTTVNFTPTSRNLGDLAGAITVNGGIGGVTNLVFDDRSNSLDDTYTVTNSTVASSDPALITYHNVQSISLMGGSGTDVYNVRATAADTATTINPGAGHNVVNVGSAAPAVGGVVDDIQGPLTVAGGASVTLNVDDTGSSGSKTGTLTATTVTGLGMGPDGITYSGLGALQIRLGSGGNAFTIKNSASGTNTSLNTGAGVDSVDVQGTGGATTVNTGIGTNTIDVGSLAPAAGGIVDHIAGPLTLISPLGLDVLNVDDSGSSVDKTGTLTAMTLTGLGMAGSITFSQLQAVNVSLGSGTNNFFSVASTATGTNTKIDASLGSSTINVGSVAQGLAGVVDNIRGPLNVHGGPGVDVLSVNDTGSTTGKTGSLTLTSVSGLAMAATITYDHLQTVAVSLGSGTNTFNVLTTHTATSTINGSIGINTVNVKSTSGPTNVNAGTGNTAVNVGSLAPMPGGIVDNISGPLTFTGGSGTDVLNVDDTGNANPKTGILTTTTLTGLGMAGGINYFLLKLLNLNLGPAAYQFTIASTHPAVTNVNLGSGRNIVNVQSTAGQTTVNASSGNDILNVGSLAPAAGGMVDGIAGPLILNGGLGQDIANVDDTGSTAAKNGTLTGTTLTGLSMAGGITYAGLRSLNITLGSGNDNITITGTHTASTVVNTGASNATVNVLAINGSTLVQGGSGSDTFVVGSPVAATSRTIRTIAGPLFLVGGSPGGNRVVVTADVDFTLSDWNLRLSNGDSYGLQSVQQAVLTGGLLDNSFDVTNWSGMATLNGGGGNDRVIASGDANFVLTDTGLTRSTGASFNLNGINAATLSGGPGNNTLDATGFGGQAWLYGGAGNDTLRAGSGDDYLDGGTGVDVLVGGAGTDILVGNSGSGDTFQGGAGTTTIYGSAAADNITAGSGTTIIYSGGGGDTVAGGTGNDTIVSGPGANTIHAGSGSNLVIGGGHDVIYGSPTGFDTLYGMGSDTVHAGAGNDVIFNVGGANSIDGGGPATIVNTVPAGSVPVPIPSVPAPPSWPPQIDAAATLPSAADYPGRWTELAGSATGGGLSNSSGQALEPAIVAGSGVQFVTWADSRTGTFAIYAALHTSAGWQELAGSSHGAGVSATTGPSRRPSISLSASGQPLIAYTVFSGSASDIAVAAYDPSANGGSGGWVGLGSSLAGGGISGTGAADNAVIVNTATGPVVAWLDRSGGSTNVYVKQYVGGSWVALGSGAASGSGLSASASNVADLSLATDGANVAVAWTQTVGSTNQIYLQQYSGGVWSSLGGSASGGGISNSTGQAGAASLAYLSGSLYVAWQDSASGTNQVYAASFNGAAWVPAGTGAASAGGVSQSLGQATNPSLSANNGRLYLVWLDNYFPNLPGNTTAVYTKRWNGSAFTEEILGDAQFQGVSGSLGVLQTPVLSTDPLGHPFVAWGDFSSGSPQVKVRGNAFEIGTAHYVNGGSTVGAVFTTATGSDSNDGVTAGTPKASIQAVLDDAVHPLHPGDVILVDVGTYSTAVNLGASAAGVLIHGAPNAMPTVSGAVTVSSATSAILDNLMFTGGLTLTGTTNFTLENSSLSGLGINLNGGSANHLVHNTINVPGVGISLTGGVDGTIIENNTITAGSRAIALSGSGATALSLRGNRLGGSGIGIDLAVAATGHVSGNDVTATATGIAINAAFTGLIEKNDIHNASVGVTYAVGVALSQNRIHDNATGLISTVADTAGGLGFFGAPQPNQIFANGTGVQLTGVMQNQHIYGNQTGVSGSGALVASDLAHANVIEANNTGVNFSGPIEFNRIDRNAIGIQAQSSQLIAHNLIYRNTGDAVLVRGQTDVRIFNNTFYTPAGDLVHIQNSSSNVQLENNIFWTSNGYDIYVANDSQGGFFSDYNDLYASGSGRLVYWSIDFTDLLDWQQDVYRYDLHSIGSTVVNPGWAAARFVSVGLDNYQVFDLLARQRGTSPTLDAGDPLADQALPAAMQNLLTNPGFESGLTGWTALPSGGTQSSSPTPWQGSNYFFAGANAVTTLDQTVDLTASGFSGAQLDSLNPNLVFGGRIRSASENPPDSGSITVTFYDGSGNVLHQYSASAGNTTDRWELVGSQVSIPTGARTARFRFTAVRASGSTDDSYLDGTFVYVVPNAKAPDLGAYGDTAAEAVRSSSQHLVLRSPDLYADWLRDKPLPIRWDSLGNVANAPVRIDLILGNTVINITPATPDSGEFDWIAANSGIGYGTYGLRIQISLVGDATVYDRSRETFTVPENNNSFFVNDGTAQPGDITSVPGSNRNDGKLASAPKPYPNNILRIYTLGPTQTLFIDAGDYGLLTPLVLSGITGIGDDRAFTLTGPTDPSRPAVLHFASPLTVAPIMELNDADFMTLQNLTLQNGQFGVWAHNNSSNLTANYLTLAHNSVDGLLIEGSPNLTLSHVIAFNSGQTGILAQGGTSVLDMGSVTASGNSAYGIWVHGTIGRLHDSTVSFNGLDGINLLNPGSVALEASTIANNGGAGIWIEEDTTDQSVIGNRDLTKALGNIIRNNSGYGILAYGKVLVAGNVVSGSLSANTAGISLSSEAVGNIVFNNLTGISQFYGTGAIHENRVYDNVGVGIYADLTSPVYDNVVYSNASGIQLAYSYSAEVSANLIYANMNQGLLIQAAGSSGAQIVNNTIYQRLGDAVTVQSMARNIHLRNNILWVQGGYDLSVAADSQAGFTSDYNLLYTTGTGQVGLWQGVPRPNLLSWRSADFTDQNSLAQDPLFINPTGAGGFLGYHSPADDGRDDDFHEQSTTGSFHGGALAPVMDMATGLPVFLSPTLTADGGESPAIDRGDPTDSSSAEPAPNGGYVNLGAFGGTVQASLSPNQYLLVTSPAGGEVWPQRQIFTITWRNSPITDVAPTVDINLMQVGNPTPVLNIATGAANTGQFSWTIPSTLTPGNTYLVQVTSDQHAALTGTSAQPFTITTPTNVYYVNDGTVNPGDWTSAPGNDSNDGLTTATPKASIGAILSAYHLNPMDVIKVDAGTYNLSSTIVLGAAASGITIEGNPDPARPTVLNRGNTSTNVIDVEGAVNVTLDHLQITAGNDGIVDGSSSPTTGLTVSNCTVFANLSFGIFVGPAGDHATLTGNTIYGTSNQATGVYVTAIGAIITGNVVHDSRDYGLLLNVNGAHAAINNNNVYASGFGINAVSYSVGPGDLTTISGNTVHDNNAGITAFGNILIAGNTAYGHTGYQQSGILAYGGVEVRGNVAHDNYWGIYGFGNGPQVLVSANTVYNNSVGIVATYASPILNNVSYSNTVGIQLDGFSGLAANNLVYANSAQGFLITNNYTTTTVRNNTVYQPAGNAIQVQSVSKNVVLRNNILWTQAGYDITVASNSEQGFQSDYNDLYFTTSSGGLGTWGGVSFSSLTDWSLRLSFDHHSLSTDPLFVNLAGLDFRLQTGSPAIDHGDPSDLFDLEPAPNGGRIDLGAYGNTLLATPSPAQELQVLSPNGLEKLQIGQTVPITWRTAGLYGPADYYSSDILADHPLAYYRLGETSGTMAADASGNSLNATYTGGVQLGNLGALPFDPNTAVQLDGNSGYVQLPSGFADFTTGFTAELWAFPTTVANYQTFFDLSNGPYSDNILLVREGTTNNLLFQTYYANSGGPVVRAVNAIELNKWQHFTITMDGLGNVSLYKNGALLVTGATTVPRNLVRTSNSLGRTGFGGYAQYAGKLDEVAFYGTALSPARVQDHYAHSAFGTVNIDLVQGSTVTRLVTSVPDSGSYLWTIPATVPAGSNYQVRVTANDGVLPSGLSSQPFLIANGGHSFYLDPAGDNANSGKSPDQPMASLSALLTAYSPHAGDTVYVAAGTYNLLGNVVLGPQNSGLHIVGPGSGPAAIFNRGNTSAGSYVFELQGATDVLLDHLGITGGLYGVYAAIGSGSTGLTVSNSTVFANSAAAIDVEGSNDHATVLGNSVHGQDQGIIVNASDSTITQNTVYGSVYYGIFVAISSGHGTVSNNDVSTSGTGIFVNSYGVGDALVSDNTVHNNNTGISAYGSVQVSDNTVYGQTGYGQAGISVYGAEARGNVVHDNYYGISAYANIAPIDGNTVYNNSVGILAQRESPVLQNRVYGNGIGIQLDYFFDRQAANNLVYANTTQGILVTQYSSPAIINNTVYQSTGNAIQIQGSNINVVLRNNIIWAQAGYDLSVAADSEPGFKSDYNLLYTTTAGGKLVSWQGQDLLTLPDWIYRVGQDFHGLFADPLFVNLAGLDFRLQVGSPAIDRGDPSDTFLLEPAPNGGRVDLGAYGNTPLATLSPAQELQVLSPNGLEKLQIGQAVPITWRTGGLYSPADYYSSDILADHPLAYYRLGESSGTTAADASGNSLNATYTGGVQLGNPGVLPFDPNTAAQLDGSSGYVQLPSGFADFTKGFTAELWVYPTTTASNQIFFDLGNGLSSYDNILLSREGTSNNLLFQTYSSYFPGPVVRAINAIEPNKWQLITVTMDGLGNVSLYKNGVLLGTGSTSTPRNVTRTINYLGKATFGNPPYAGGLDEVAFYPNALSAARVQDHYAHRTFGTVNIDLVPSVGPMVNIATGVSDSGSYTWTIPASVPLGSGYRIQITANDGMKPSGLSSQPFQVTNGGHSFYIDPAGDDSNSGKSPDQPMASLSALLAAYSPHSGDTVYVAAGTYNLLVNVVLGPQNSGLHIVGPSTGPAAIFNRGNASAGSYGFELRGVTNLLLDHLGITAGVNGVYAANGSGSTGLTVSNSTVFANSTTGIFLDVSNDNANLTGDTLYGVPGSASSAQAYGIYLNANSEVVSNNTVYGHSGSGILAAGVGTTISGNLVYGNAIGIYAQVSSPAAVDRDIVSGNIVHDNTGAGISGGGNLLITGNTIYGQSGPTAAGVQMTVGGPSPELASNDIYGNTNGIVVLDGFVHNNRVYNNTAAGITASQWGYASMIVANQVYSNNVGIQGIVNFIGLIANNLVYANTTTGILLESSITYPQRNVINNTVYQVSGSAVRVDGATANVKLRNNILWVQAGYDIYVADDSHTGFSSDYNLLHTGTDPNAHVGFWNSSVAGGTRDQLSDWQSAATQDANSGNGDPRFVDLDGADNLLGYTQVGGVYGDHGRDDNFYLAASSPAIAHGDSVSGPVTDIEGYARKPGAVDLGAYGFRGDPSQTTPPTVTATTPAAIDAGGNTSVAITTFAISFSKDVNPIDADAAAVYDLRKAGSHGFGSADDVVYALTPHYTAGSDVVTLAIAGLGSTGLPSGNYRLTLTSNANTSIHDLEGFRLDGNADGLEGGDYVRTFVVLPGVTQSGSGQSVAVNTAFANPLVITITDSSGNPVPNVSVSFAAPGSGASGIFSNSTANITGTTNSLGQISETFTANTVAGSYTVMASVMGFSSPFSFRLTNQAGPVSQFLAAAQGGPATVAGRAFLVVVQAADMFGNPVTSYGGPPNLTANINPASPGSSFPSTVPIDSHGLGLFLANVYKVGSYTITLSSGTFTGATSPVTVTAGPAVKLGFGTQPANTPTGNVLPTVTVQVLDMYGNVITTDNTDSVILGIAAGPGSFRSGSTLTATVHNGVASFSNLTLIQPGSYALSAVVPTLFTGPNSNAFTVMPLQVLPGSFTGTPSGFSLQFNTSYLVNSLTPVLFGPGFGSSAAPSSVILTTDPAHLNDTAAYVEGSLVLDPATNAITFVATNTALLTNNGSPVLPDGTYTAIIRSSAATNGFQALSSGGGFLDGRGTGTPGSGDYTASFTVHTAGADVLWVPATADGPGQALNAPGNNQLGSGYPIYLNDTTGQVTRVQVTVDYNPALLTVTDVSGAGFTLLGASTPGHAVLQYSGPALPAGSQVPVGYLIARVPGGTTANPTPYKAKDLLHLSNVALNSGAIPVVASDALHLVAYVGDGDGNGAYSSNDAVLITRVALQTDAGFAAYPLVDPVIVADTDGSGFIPADAALQANEAGVGFPTANLTSPPVPSGVIFQAIANNVDPSLSLGVRGEGPGASGERVVTVEVNLDDTAPEGSTGLLAGHLAFAYDPKAFTVSAADVHLGSLLEAHSGWSVVPTVDPVTGQIAIALWSTTPISSSQDGSLVTIDFHQIGTAPGTTAIQLVKSVSINGQYVPTELEDAQGTFTLTPAPTNGLGWGSESIVTLTASTPRLVASCMVVGAPAPVEFLPESGSVAGLATLDTGASPAAADPANPESSTQAGVRGPSDVTQTVQVSASAAPGESTQVAAALIGLSFPLANTLGALAPGWLGVAAGQPVAEPLFPVLVRALNPNDVTLRGGTIQNLIERVLTSPPLQLRTLVEDLNGDALQNDLEEQELGAWLAPEGRQIRRAAEAEPPRYVDSQAAAQRASLDLYFAQISDESRQEGEDE